MTDVTVVVAMLEDIDALVESVIELVREDAGRHDPATDVGWPVREGAAYYSALVGDPACLLALARDGDRILGHVVGKLTEPISMRRERLAVLESLRVDPAFRERGIGGLLIRYFLDWAREHDALRASVTAFAANEGAQRLYARYGFTPMSIVMRTALRRSPAE